VLSLPYQHPAFAMDVVLPRVRYGLAALEAHLGPELLDELLRDLDANVRQVNVWLPKFRIVPTEPVRLRAPLTQLGMPEAFDMFRADFSGIAPCVHPDDRLSLSDVFHQAFISVDEAGTEAAAASAAVMAPPSAPPRPGDEPVEFRADHPFLFLIRDRRSGAVLFLGRLVDPTA